ncbi:hypothetical protein Tco_0923926 [Tanacetum coccineum]|uniref:Uncharacterized protein n=1 Tax=Tanacetum coccineum TaxID=301880 RepID=A0ABQ5D3H0_9ASTR
MQMFYSQIKANSLSYLPQSSSQLMRSWQTEDESIYGHRRLGQCQLSKYQHVRLKQSVRVYLQKTFKLDHSCVAERNQERKNSNARNSTSKIGVAERKNMTLIEAARTMIISKGKVPDMDVDLDLQLHP